MRCFPFSSTTGKASGCPSPVKAPFCCSGREATKSSQTAFIFSARRKRKKRGCAFVVNAVKKRHPKGNGLAGSVFCVPVAS